MVLASHKSRGAISFRLQSHVSKIIVDIFYEILSDPIGAFYKLVRSLAYSQVASLCASFFLYNVRISRVLSGSTYFPLRRIPIILLHSGSQAIRTLIVVDAAQIFPRETLIINREITCIIGKPLFSSSAKMHPIDLKIGRNLFSIFNESNQISMDDE